MKAQEFELRRIGDSLMRVSISASTSFANMILQPQTMLHGFVLYPWIAQRHFQNLTED